jgi:hypothetical protein
MLELQEFSVEHNCRLVLTGDTKQHHSVQWGDALRILERSGVIAQAELTKIYRQRIPQLREAIEDLSKGRTLEGFNKLDKFGVLQEISDDAVRLTIAEKQIEALQAQRSSLIIAPTHGECRAIAGAVRQAMKEKGLLSDIEHSVMRLKRLNLGETIRTAIGKRVQGARHKVDAEWRYLLDDYLFKTGASGGRDLEENAREEPARKCRVAFVGADRSGRNRKNHVTFHPVHPSADRHRRCAVLAPTGKARVRVEQSTQVTSRTIRSRNSSARIAITGQRGANHLSDKPVEAGVRNVIIDKHPC